jgi:hypothetical protein
MPNPRGTRPSPFDAVQTKSRGFKKFTRKIEAIETFKRFERSFKAFDPLGQQGERIIEIDNDHVVRVVGLPPPSSDADPLNTGILQAMDEAIIEEITAIAKEN